MYSINEDEDILRPLTSQELNDLLRLYKENYSTANYHYLLIYNQCKWDKQLNNITGSNNSDETTQEWLPFVKTFYTHRHGNLSKHGTYISVQLDCLLSISFHSLESSLRELKECLFHTKRIDWKIGPLLTGVNIEYSKVIEEIVERMGGIVEESRECYSVALPHSTALDLTLPRISEGYAIWPLDPQHADSIHSQWPNKMEATVQYVRGLINLNQTLGLYRLEENELVAWIFQNEYAGLGILQVLPTEQRKGFGHLLATQLSKRIANSENIDILAFFVKGNQKSEKLFQKIGFKKCATSKWIKLRAVK